MAKEKISREQEQLELGKKLQQFYEMGCVNKKQALIFSFYKGLASGFGAFLGGTIVIGLLLWILSIFGHVPFVDHIVNPLRGSLDK